MENSNSANHSQDVQEEWTNRATRSLVRVQAGPNSMGMGFAVPGDLIITAAHCIPDGPKELWFCENPMIVSVRPFGSKRIASAAVIFIDPRQDIAVLASLYDAGLNHTEKELGDYEEMMAELDRIPLAPCQFPMPAPRISPPANVSIRIFTVDQRWVSGNVKIFNPIQPGASAQLSPSSARIIGGTSGAPVFNDRGQSVGVICSSPVGRPEATFARLPESLPLWLIPDIYRVD